MATDLAELERRLWEAADELRANSKLTAHEYRDPVLGLISDLLTCPGPDLTAEERKTVKGIARHLLGTVTDKLLLDSRKRQRSSSAVHVAVGQALHDLPKTYDEEIFEQKRNVAFDHLLASFFDDRGSVYPHILPPV